METDTSRIEARKLVDTLERVIVAVGVLKANLVAAKAREKRVAELVSLILNEPPASERVARWEDITRAARLVQGSLTVDGL